LKNNRTEDDPSPLLHSSSPHYSLRKIENVQLLIGVFFLCFLNFTISYIFASLRTIAFFQPGHEPGPGVRVPENPYGHQNKLGLQK